MENTRISYEIENIIKKIDRAIKEEEAKRDAWKAVKIVTKKDGTAFTNFAKNFDGARVTFPAYSLGGGKELTVTTWNPATGYISDTINLYEVLSAYTRNEKAEEKPENIKRNGSGVADFYVYDVDDAAAAIAHRIAYYEDVIEENKKALATARAALDKFFTLYYNALADLKEKAAPLYYEARSAAANIYA